jgi:ASC-1-like (ASCH) protein
MKKWTLRFRAVDKKNFEELRSGIKPIETRAASVKYRPMAIGDEIKFICGSDSFVRKISKRHQWPSIDAMVEDVSFKKIMPSVDSVAAMKKVYASYPGYIEKIQKDGILGFEFT